MIIKPAVLDLTGKNIEKNIIALLNLEPNLVSTTKFSSF